ncbi:MAG: helix-turn-helix domain-containing protein [Elusimicrobiales bacterium]|nr:helix-turn-helix domain-containing protein [Elusimicrobiales bacterium]
MTGKKNYFTIEEASKITGIKKYTLRYWERKIGLIKPIRLDSKHRRYTQLDIEIIEKIKEMISNGYSLEGIKKILHSKKLLNNTPRQELKEILRYKKILSEMNKELKDIIKNI